MPRTADATRSSRIAMARQVMTSRDRLRAVWAMRLALGLRSEYPAIVVKLKYESCLGLGDKMEVARSRGRCNHIGFSTTCVLHPRRPSG